jgi:uncharacterized protein
MKSWLVLLLILLCQIPAFCALEFDGFIADEAGILSKSAKQDLNMTLWDLQKKSQADIAVVIVKSLDGKSVEQAALDIGRSYKIGSKEKNNGVVFLTALKEHRMRIELGTGLEDKIPVSSLEKIRDNDILPYYRQDDYESGILRGTYKLANLVADAEGVKITLQGNCPVRAAGGSSSKEHPPLWVYIIALLMAPFSGRRRRGYGSFGGFGGGGGFGGSGCSGGW